MTIEPRGPIVVYAPDVDAAPVRVTELPIAPNRVLAHPDWIDLLRDIAGEFYASVQRAREVEPPEPIAPHHLIIATTAIAATELETLQALGVLGLHRSAAIHGRSVGLLARNAVVFHEDAELAQSCYDGLDASRNELAALGLAIINDALLDVAMEKRFEAASGTSMRKLEQTHRDRFRVDTGGLITAFDQNAWSKWNHGDVIALADAADRIRAGGNVRDSINLSNNLMLQLLLSAATSAVLIGLVLQHRNLIESATLSRVIQRINDLEPTLQPLREAARAARNAVQAQNEEQGP